MKHARRTPQEPDAIEPGDDPFDYDNFLDDGVPEGRFDPNHIRLAKRWIPILIGLLIVFLVFSWARGQFNPQGDPGKEIAVEIPRGASTTQIADLLTQHGVVPNALAFRASARLHDAGQFQAGEYDFNLNSSTGEALAVVRAGPNVVSTKLTIPEGSTVKRIAADVGKLRGMSEQRFLELAQSGTIRSEYQPDDVDNLEGFLFPDTYLLSPSDNEEVLIKRMVSRFDTMARRANLDSAQRSISRTPYEALIIASLIEAEAKVDQDRAKISQVIENRLRKNMRLDIDATVLYALGNEKNTLSSKDLQVKSPYNTRQVGGLPPTPICNPGLESMLAALRPEPGPWLYYVLSDPSGSHSFASTLEEHNRNVAAARAKGLL